MGYEQNRDGYNRSSYGNGGQQTTKIPQAVEIDSFYASDGKTIKPDLFDKKALEIANSFLGTDRNGNSVGVSSTQLRRLFDEVKRFKQVLESDPEQWESELPYIKMIKSKVAYTVARAAKTKPSAKQVYNNLLKFISSSIDLIQKSEDYHVFVSLFEAAYGFYYEKAPKD